jgi:hypothetical protein
MTRDDNGLNGNRCSWWPHGCRLIDCNYFVCYCMLLLEGHGLVEFHSHEQRVGPSLKFMIWAFDDVLWVEKCEHDG